MICPTVTLIIEGIEIDALVDTGSQVTVISEKFYKNNIEIFKKCPQLPLCGQVIKSAINEKSTILKIQTLCNIKINDFIDDVVFIVVPRLCRDTILGYDFIKNYSIIIDSGENKMYNEKYNLNVNFNISSNQNEVNSLYLYVENILQLDEIKFDDADDITEYEIDEKLYQCDLSPSKQFLLKKVITENKKLLIRDQDL